MPLVWLVIMVWGMTQTLQCWIKSIIMERCVQAQTQQENWVGVLQEVALPDTDGTAQSFLSSAVAFCNNECW